MLTHQIPYESLGVDLHQVVSSNKSLICLSLSLSQNNKKVFINPPFSGSLKSVKCALRQTCRYFNSPVNISNQIKDIESTKVNSLNATPDLKQANVIYGLNFFFLNLLLLPIFIK